MAGADETRRRVLAGAGALALYGGLPAWAQPRAAKPRVALHTAKGDIVIELEPQRAPLTAGNFLHYVDAGKYDAATFYRATLTGDRRGTGTLVGEPNARVRPFPPIAHEPTTQTGLKHVAGAVSLGRFAPGSATDTFFICLDDQPYLDAHPGAKGDNLGYAVFGRVVAGMAVVRRIHALPTSRTAPFPDQRGQWLKRPEPILTARRVIPATS